MLTGLYIDNYKSFVNFNLGFENLNLLLGGNGSGKTSVLDVLSAIQKLLGGTAKVSDGDIFPSSTLTRWQLLHLQTFTLSATLNNENYVYHLLIAHPNAYEGGPSKSQVLQEALSVNGRSLFHFEDGEVTLFKDADSGSSNYSADWSESALARVPAHRKEHQNLIRFREFIQNIIICKLEPLHFVSDAVSEDAILAKNGSNFACWYRHLVQENAELLSEYIHEIQHVIDGFKSIRLEKAGVETRIMKIKFEHRDQSYELLLNELSDGQRVLLVLYAFIYFSTHHAQVIILDEPDNFMALSEIQPWLMALKDKLDEGLSQVIICSHHPELMNYLGKDAGILLNREKGGITTVKSIVELPLQEDVLPLSERFARGWI